ncbi:hypothetical protein LA080_001914 [Diaporthe eres]|uniref:Alcohol dehydrogenase-like N-terminal domain-containing protein n=1 Tax=Diaporthe vaccinii TaxID=105482 RepID=A0ABR4EVP2_9PEZI|nr:hypothetical protein LA080_001914 [Diaporthe eres]
MQNYSLVRRGAGTAVLEHTKVPTLPDDYVLVRTKAVALNPTDWTTLDAVGDDGTIVGCDYAGVVEDVGQDAAKRFRKGDRIAGFGHGGNDANPENGAFARYIAVKGDIQMHIPNHVSFEAASTVGVGICTVGLWPLSRPESPTSGLGVQRPWRDSSRLRGKHGHWHTRDTIREIASLPDEIARLCLC